MKTLAVRRLVLLSVTALIPIVFLTKIGPPPVGTETTTALRIMTTIIAILAGFLMGVITMLGDTRGLFRGNWRIASAHRRENKGSLVRLLFFLYIYLVAISVAFAAALFDAYAPRSYCTAVVHHIALIAGAITLLWSFGLPAVLFRVQQERLADEVEYRKEQDRQEDIRRHSLSSFDNGETE